MQNKRMLSAVFVAVILCAGFLIVLPEGDAGNVGADVLTTAYLPSDFQTKAIEWAPTGDVGVAVGINTGQGQAWEVVDPAETAADWTDVAGGPLVDAFYGAAWDASGNDRFVVCGQDTGVGNNVYTVTYPGPVWATLGGGTSDTNHIFFDVAVAPGTGTAVVVGTDGTNGIVRYWDGAWQTVSEISGATLPAANDVLNGITYDATSQAFYIVGENGANGVIYRVNESELGGGPSSGLYAGVSNGATPALNAIEWCSEPGEDYALAVGDGVAATSAGVYSVTTTGEASLVSEPILLQNTSIGADTWTLYDVGFNFSAGGINEALIVGESSGGDGLILRYQDAESEIIVTNATDSNGILQGGGTPFYAVGYKPYGSPRYATVGGAGGNFVKYAALEAARTITVNTLYPHISAIDMYQGIIGGGGASVLNEHVDVDPGTGSEVYTIKLDCYHNDGWIEVNEIHLYIWHDGGATGGGSTFPAGNNDNTRAHFVYFQSNSTFFTPNPGNFEIELTDSLETVVSGTEYDISFEVRFNSQAWASPGAMNPATGGNQDVDGDAKNDAWTWDIEAYIDGDGGGSDVKWDEFGLYDYTELLTQNTPVSQTGSGAPSSTIPLNPGTQPLTFKANTQYSVKVWTTDLTDGTNWIPATAMEIEGGIINGGRVNFGGAGEASSQYLIGAGGASENPNMALNETEIDALENSIGEILVTWGCDIPNVAESTYTGTATYVIES